MRPLLKYCGNKSEADLAVTVASEADYLGFVFVPGTKREVDPDHVKAWLDRNPVSDKKLVALFVNEQSATIHDICKKLPIDVIQCHGNESPEFVTEIKRTTGKKVWKVIHHHSEGMVEMRRYDAIADGYIIDAKVEGQWGGTGKTFDWDCIPAYIKEGKRQSVPVFIAGGVDASNIQKLSDYDPDGIDLSSGIEIDGTKSQQAIKRLEKELYRRDNSIS
ncbi:phosphoribosylanthranilate isomerase [Alkalicoccobacillus murimartini]|uniref:N-(5'-phosphoribosyl)anthranilate isomerase n=2 Tax=Alkalicoccobacillus murimartini TaxID=171685 RepID=A0ABT9YDK8_9BACI|nr:phosphoribosylanthranilate isomerase [Alkalicoccobacillus murimartini]